MYVSITFLEKYRKVISYLFSYNFDIVQQIHIVNMY